nr:NAD(P)/FAD-dependent oxidoreductase [Planktothricoides sp. SR001]
MEIRHCPGLFLAVKILDIDGITGGFNFLLEQLAG